MIISSFLLVVALSSLQVDPVSGERFGRAFQRVSVTIEEDTVGPDLLERPLECPGFDNDFYLGNEEPIPFAVESDQFFVDLIMTRTPDTELGDELFEVLVVCDDRDPSPPPDTATVTVTITSRNEYTPYSPRDTYSISFSEATSAGQVVGSVGDGSDQYLVVDEDGGADGVLVFTALDDPPNPYLSVDPDTGDIILLRELDYEVEVLESAVEIHVCDQATPASLCPNVTISFSLTGINDNDPYFLKPLYHSSIEEGLHRATEIVVNITCADRDVGVGSYEGMEVVSSTVGLVQLTDTSSGTAQLLLTAALDYDLTNNTEVEVQLFCYDNEKGEAQRRATTTVKIEVLPANDNRPQFTTEWYNTSVVESLPVGSLLLTTVCSDQDRDFGKFKAISLLEPSSAVDQTFSIHPTTGQLTLTATLDYDNPATRSYVFSIRCIDEGGLDATSKVAIFTLPVSDERLSFQSSVFSFTVDRLTNIDSRIGQVVAIDGDQGQVPVISYSLESNDLFEIDNEGHIVLTEYPSRDKESFFNLTVEARDSEGVVEAQVHITISGPFSIVEAINVGTGGAGVIVVLIIGIMVAVCTYFCVKLYRGSSEATTEVPVRYMSGDRIPYQRRPPSAHSRSSGGAKDYLGTLRDRSTLSMQRKKKQKAQSFKKKPRRRPGLRDSIYSNSLHSQAAPPDDDMLGLNPADFEMNIFKNEGAVQEEKEELKTEMFTDLDEEEEEEESTHNIFNPEDAGLLLGDIMMFPGEEPRWGQEEDGNVVDLGSWGIVEHHEPPSEGSESGSEGAQSGEWDPSGSMEWEEDQDPFTFI